VLEIRYEIRQTRDAGASRLAPTQGAWEREIIETALRLWLQTKQAKLQPEISDTETAFTNFIGCAQGDPMLSTDYKERLTERLKEKYGYR